MYVVTFYSYKGGVGRTLALVNIAALLAQQGRRVLAVDFDLEAPSLPDFDIFKESVGKRGIVDYVTEYRESGIAPDCRDFIVPCDVAGKPIWVMPAGCNTAFGYTDMLNDIDWKELYEAQDGYLMFEDLKQQWSEYNGHGFDYVLIDSRTGHTDVGGICTRQLPDAVNIMFLPNSSNISGLLPIVGSIRDENAFRETEIALHLTPTNVPDLDDEKSILAKLMTQACDELNDGRKFPVIIHHYQSLDILETRPFSISRPNSKLSREYEQLRLQIIGQNLEDREGALYTLSATPEEFNTARAMNDTFRREALLERTRNILLLHPKDGEIGFSAAQAFEALGDQAFELEALGVAIDQQYEVDRSRLIRGVKTLSVGGKTENSVNDLIAIIKSKSATAFEIIPALQFLRDLVEDWASVAEAAIDRPDDQYKTILSVASYLMSWKEAVLVCAHRLLELTKYAGLSDKARTRTQNYTSLCLIASGNFQQAIEYIDHSVNASDDRLQPQHLFNLAMATWGLNERPPQDLLRKFINHPEMSRPDFTVNTRQCLALANGALGETAEALAQLALADQFLTPGDTSFSCWSYLNASSEELKEHFSEMEDAFNQSRTIRPRFFAPVESAKGVVH